ncbi:MAG: diguanylate cyclase [Coriobacteriales bacterium]|nr:diguanylate cyclase [Coriobacteriales bacterium]
MDGNVRVRRPIERSLLVGSFCFLLALGAILSTLIYSTFASALYKSYDDRLNHVLEYVEHNADADDLARCIKTQTPSAKYGELQAFLNSVIDEFDLQYLYIVIPSSDTMTNVVSATSTEERKAGEDDVPLLETTDAYSAEELERYLSSWNTDGVSYFEESSDYGAYYTGCKPLKDSNGNVVALICADFAIDGLHNDLSSILRFSLLASLLVFVLFGTFMTIWVRKRITSPLLALEQSARDFANRSHDAKSVAQLTYEPPAIRTQNEVRSLAETICTMASDIQRSVGDVLAAQARTVAVERENVRLAEEAKAAAKISELSESVSSLLYNMPGLSFSKDVSTGVYLACNQEFANYAHKSSPSEVVGLTDFDIFDQATAQHFASDDQRAMLTDKPLVIFEDVLDAVGNPRHLRTTKMKFNDTKGRQCVLGMSEDVTDLMEAKQEAIEAQRAFKEARDASVTYYGIARALSADYSNIFYVDLSTDQYTEYRHDSSSESWSPELQGEDFFKKSREDAMQILYPADHAMFLEAFTKENVMRSIDEFGTFTLSYRQMIDGKPVYMGMKAIHMEGDAHRLVIGVSDIDAKMKYQEETKRAREERATYARITALAGDYLAIYTVDPSTNSYSQYSATSTYDHLCLAKSGADFFEDTLRQGASAIYEEDRNLVFSMLKKENVLSDIQTTGIFVLNYRLVLEGVPTYVSLKAAMVDEKDGPQLIVGVSNIDAQVKRDREFALAMLRANRDALTGANNKHAYVDAESELDQKIENGEPVEFALVVCDLNNLKQTNDTLGHRAGDALIRTAYNEIRNIFSLSPVFRVGGDEFAVILQGHDYQHARELTAQLSKQNARAAKTGGAVIAWGLAFYQHDASVAAVFNRADVAMYENKRLLKAV